MSFIKTLICSTLPKLPRYLGAVKKKEALFLNSYKNKIVLIFTDTSTLKENSSPGFHLSATLEQMIWALDSTISVLKKTS